jgi:hypothetical protein
MTGWEGFRESSQLAIIGGDIHTLITIKAGADWSSHPWRVHEAGNQYWVPIPDSKLEKTSGYWEYHRFLDDECPVCRRQWYSSEINKRY